MQYTYPLTQTERLSTLDVVVSEWSYGRELAAEQVPGWAVAVMMPSPRPTVITRRRRIDGQ